MLRVARPVTLSNEVAGKHASELRDPHCHHLVNLPTSQTCEFSLISTCIATHLREDYSLSP